MRQSQDSFAMPTATSPWGYCPLCNAAISSPMTIWQGKQMSLWVYFLPRAISSGPPTGSVTARMPSRSMSPCSNVDTGAEMLGTSSVRSCLSRFRYLAGYGSGRRKTDGGASCCRFRRSCTVSRKDWTRMPREPEARLSSIFSTSGGLPLSPRMRISSSDNMASWPQPKLTICTYSSAGMAAVTSAPDSIRAWKSLVISTRDWRRSASSSPGRLSTVSTGMPFRVNISDRLWLTKGSV